MLKFLGEWWQEGRISTNFTQLYMAKNLTIMANFYHSLSSCMPLTGLKKKKTRNMQGWKEVSSFPPVQARAS
jgi:hypothetical protein